METFREYLEKNNLNEGILSFVAFNPKKVLIALAIISALWGNVHFGNITSMKLANQYARGIPPTVYAQEMRNMTGAQKSVYVSNLAKAIKDDTTFLEKIRLNFTNENNFQKFLSKPENQNRLKLLSEKAWLDTKMKGTEDVEKQTIKDAKKSDKQLKKQSKKLEQSAEAHRDALERSEEAQKKVQELNKQPYKE